MRSCGGQSYTFNKFLKRIANILPSSVFFKSSEFINYQPYKFDSTGC